MYNDLNNYHNKLLSNVNKIDAFDTKQCIKQRNIDKNMYKNLETCNFNKFDDDSKIECNKYNKYNKLIFKKNINYFNANNDNDNDNFLKTIFNYILLLIISILFVIGAIKKNSMYIITILLILILYVFIKISNII